MKHIKDRCTILLIILIIFTLLVSFFKDQDVNKIRKSYKQDVTVQDLLFIYENRRNCDIDSFYGDIHTNFRDAIVKNTKK